MTKSLNNVSPLQRRLLISHIDGPKPFQTFHGLTIAALIRGGLLTGVPEQSIRPTHTRLTHKGRETLAEILAEAAEALVEAGFLPEDIVEKVRERPIYLVRPPATAKPLA